MVAVAPTPSPTRAVQAFVEREYLVPARRRKAAVARVPVGEIVREMGLWKRVPLVCAALQTKKFLREQSLEIESREGPPSGQSSSVVITYRLQPATATPTLDSELNSLWGLLKDTYKRLGGAEAFHRAERASWEKGWK